MKKSAAGHSLIYKNSQNGDNTPEYTGGLLMDGKTHDIGLWVYQSKSEIWKILFGTVDSQYGIGDPEWEDFDCGFDVGLHLKSTTGWYGEGNGIDDFGFTIVPAGFYAYFHQGSYGNIHWSSDFRTSSEDEDWSAWNWNFHYLQNTTWQYADEKEFGYSVRCLMD